MNPLRNENTALAAWRDAPPASRSSAADLRVAVIGLGKQGSKLAKAALDGGFQLTAICDSNEERLNSFKGGTPKKALSIGNLSTDEIDLCILATLADSHYALLKKLRDAGCRAVLCEKPIVNTMRDLEGVRQLTSDGQMRLLVNHSKLWSVDVEFARSVVRSKALGLLKKVTVRFKSQGFGNIGSHMIASVLYLTERKIRAVEEASFEQAGLSRKKGTFDPNGFAIYDLDGIPFEIDNRALPTSPPGRITFTFEHGIFELNDEANILRYLAFESGDDQELLFRQPWFGSRASWPVMVDWLTRALLQLSAGGDGEKLEVSCSAVEAILAAHECHGNRRRVLVPLRPETISPFSFS